MKKTYIPIAKVLKSNRSHSATKNEEINISSLDQLILDLETSLCESNGSGSDIESEEEKSDQDNETDDFKHSNTVQGSILSSTLYDEAHRIPPLPPSVLPKPGCSRKTGHKTTRDDSSVRGNATSKRVRFRSENDQSEESSSAPKQNNDTTITDEQRSGLDRTVEALLRNYQPTSSERRPFWCRICQFQGENMEDLEAHRRSDLHVLAAEKERKISFCKVCRTQFTSPAQLREHLQGKVHKEKMEKVMARNASGKKFERS